MTSQPSPSHKARRTALLHVSLLACVSWGPVLSSGSAQPPTVAASPAPTLAPEVQAALGLQPLLDRLRALQQTGQERSVEALTTRQLILEQILSASFEIDATLGRIDTEASYASEDRYILEVHNQHQANALNLVTFAASGALGAAGSAMQLTRGLNHAGTALQAAAGGTALVLSGVQLRAGGGRQPIRMHYNMLAEVLDQPPNAESHYPPIVAAYLQAPQPDGKPSVAQGLTAAWRRLDRLKQGPKGNGTPVEDLVADRTSGRKLSAEELANREAMLHDLHANIVLLRSQLQQSLLTLRSIADAPPPTSPAR